MSGTKDRRDAGRGAGATSCELAPVPLPRLLARFAAVLAIALVRLVPLLPAALVVRLVRGRAAAARFRYRRLVRLLQALGPTFVKFAQISSTRRDAMAPELCDELSVLHDAVLPMSSRARARGLRRAYGDRLDEVFAEVGEEPLASGSIASVYRARLRDGREVALKLKRPNIDRRMAADLALLRAIVRVGERLPKMRGMPMADLIEYLSIAVLGQLDFRKEAGSLQRLRVALEPVPAVHVPALVGEHSNEHCLVLEFVPGLHRDTPESLPAEVRERLAATVLAAAHRMLFVEGFVHCDLHPGNVYLTADARVVVLDAGYSVQLPDRVRDLIGEFFACMATGNGRRCGEIVLASAVRVDEGTDVDGFVSGVAALVERAAGPGNQFDMPTFGEAMFDLQRDHGLYAASDFAFPLMSLMVLEGTVRGFDPDLDFQQVGMGRQERPAGDAYGRSHVRQAAM